MLIEGPEFFDSVDSCDRLYSLLVVLFTRYFVLEPELETRFERQGLLIHQFILKIYMNNPKSFLIQYAHDN